MHFGELFLRFPGIFPAADNSERWGDGSLLIDFLGGPYRFGGLCETQTQAIEKRFGERCRIDDETEPAIETVIYRIAESEFQSFDRRGWETRIDFDYRPGKIRMAGWRFMADIRLKPHAGAALWTPDVRDIVENGGFENLFRTIVAYRIIELGGALLHSAGMANGNHAWLFIGRSNAGKTTLSRLGLGAGLTILSDDMNAVIPDGSGYVTEQLPFAGDLGQTVGSGHRYRVRAIHHLKKGDHNAATAVASHDRLAKLMACAPFVNTNPHVYPMLVDNLDRVRREVPGTQITFTLEGGFERLLNNDRGLDDHA